MLQKQTFTLIAAVLACVFLANVTIGQKRDVVTVQNSKAADCEFNNLLLDTLIISTKKKEERLFIIARPSKNEGNQINFLRLKLARSVISDYKKGLNKSEVVIAIGESSVEKDGKLEFWIGSDLYVIISTRKNQQACFQTPDYVPKKGR